MIAMISVVETLDCFYIMFFFKDCFIVAYLYSEFESYVKNIIFRHNNDWVYKRLVSAYDKNISYIMLRIDNYTCFLKEYFPENIKDNLGLVMSKGVNVRIELSKSYQMGTLVFVCRVFF